MLKTSINFPADYRRKEPQRTQTIPRTMGRKRQKNPREKATKFLAEVRRVKRRVTQIEAAVSKAAYNSQRKSANSSAKICEKKQVVLD